MSFYIDKHLFSNTLYIGLDSETPSQEIKDAVTKKNEEAGITCYGKYNLIGFFKEKMCLAFKQTINEGNVIYVDAKSFAEWKYAEVTSRHARVNNENLAFIFDKISEQKKLSKKGNFTENRKNVIYLRNKNSREASINKLVNKVKDRIKEDKAKKNQNLLNILNEDANNMWNSGEI